MSTSPPRIRLDSALVERGLVATRSRARDLVLRGAVTVDGRRADKPAEMVGGEAALAVAGGLAAQVSRAATKLDAALDRFGLDAAGRIALDVGASTGGFTQTLLARGAARVHAVDVGRDQLHAELRADPRVVSLEGFDARRLSAVECPEPIGAIAADVSFIALAKVLPAALALAAPGCWLVALVKPQFEVGRAALGRGGIVRDVAAREAAAAGVAAFLADAGWRVLGTMPSPLPGKDGNQEHLVAAVT